MATRRTTFLLFCVSASVAACGSGTSQDNRAPANAAIPADASLNAQPVKEEHKALTLTPAWLAGRWQTEDGDCGAGDTFFALDPDGRYSFMGEAGRWSLQGDTMTIEITEPSADGGGKAGDRHAINVRAIAPNEAQFQAEGAPPTRVFRCHQG